MYCPLEINMLENIRKESNALLAELLSEAKLGRGDILVVGCSSSEIIGGRIGKASSPEAANAVLDGMLPTLRERGIFLAAQCCEHLNRALVVERECAEKYGLEIVSVVPVAKAGGSFATASYAAFKEPVVVEFVKAHAGIDIGGTLIGMHLRNVAVPVRVAQDTVGNARVLCARTRPKYIGGARAQY